VKGAPRDLIVVIALALVLLLAVAIHIGLIYTTASAPSISIAPTLPTPTSPLTSSRINENWTMLLVGLDAEDMNIATSQVRTDLLIVATLSERGRVQLLSIPRDTYVDIPSRGYSKINHAFSYGGGTHLDTGIWLTLQTVKKLLDIEIDNYVIFDLKSIPRLIDTIGGVTVEGIGELNGVEALAFARWRGDGKGDIGRIPRQHQLLQAVFNKVQTFDSTQLHSMIKYLMDQVRSDIHLKQALDIVTSMGEQNSFEVNFHVVPGLAVMKDGVSYWEPDIQRLRALLAEFWGVNSNGG